MNFSFYILLAATIPLTFFILEFVFYKVKREVSLDQSRANLFKIRNDLFLYSVENNLEEKEAAYAIRERLNSYIRFIHRADFISYYVFTMKIAKDKDASKNAKKITKEINRLINTLPEKNRDVFKEAIEKGRMEILSFMVHSSPILSIVFHCVGFGFSTKKIIEKHRENISKNIDLEISATFAH